MRTPAILLLYGMAVLESSCIQIIAPPTSGGGTTVAVPAISRVAIGSQHSCVVYQGNLECWGINQFGQTGNSTNLGTLTPFTVPTSAGNFSKTSSIQALTAGNSHSCAVVDGGAWCWGSNGYGQLGNPTNSATANPNVLPLAVTGLSSGVLDIRAGGQHTCALLTNGTVQCWGTNHMGQLGNVTNSGTFNANTTPLAVSGLAGTVVSLSAGTDFACAVITGGTIQCWGSNFYGGLANSTNSGVFTANPTPLSVTGLSSSLTVGQIYAGGISEVACVLSSDGNTLDCWGSNDYGQLDNSTNLGTNNPNIVPTWMQL